MMAMRSKTTCLQRQSNTSSVVVVPRRVVAPVAGTRPQSRLVVEASLVAPRPNSNEEGSREQPFSSMMGVPGATMAGGMGMQGAGATLERSRLSFVMPQPVVQGPKLDDGGDGGDIGKHNRNGGGGGGGGDDDDDDYFSGEDGDGDGDGQGKRQTDGFFRAAILESYDKFSIGAVLAEWMKTVQELPAILRQAVTMGLFSSAQLVRFFAMDVRPNVTRTISRRLPPSVAREFVGRLMADPGFLQKMVLESMFATGASLWYEYRLRGENFKKEADLALINSLGMAAATAATVWLLAPSRSYGSIQKFPWQQMLEGLPNCVFDVSGPLRNYSKQARAVGFLAKMAELSAVGALTGTVTSLLASTAVAARRRNDPDWQPSTPVPSIGRSSAGLAAFFALNANTRYQLIGGLDRFLFDRTNFLWTYVFLSGGARLASNQIGELSRPWWQGLPSPSTLTPIQGPSLPQPTVRKIKKKVTKRVPRVKQAAATQEQLETAAVSSMAAGAVGSMLTDTAVPLEVASTLDQQQGAPVSSVQAPEVVDNQQGVQFNAAVDTASDGASSLASQQLYNRTAATDGQAVQQYSYGNGSEAIETSESRPEPVGVEAMLQRQ